MCRPSVKKVGRCVLQLLIGNGFVTFDPGDIDLWPSDPKINRVPLLSRMDVWTMFEDGMSRCSLVIYRKRKGYRRTEGQTGWHVQSNMHSLHRLIMVDIYRKLWLKVIISYNKVMDRKRSIYTTRHLTYKCDLDLWGTGLNAT